MTGLTTGEEHRCRSRRNSGRCARVGEPMTRDGTPGIPTRRAARRLYPRQNTNSVDRLCRTATSSVKVFTRTRSLTAARVFPTAATAAHNVHLTATDLA